MKIIAFYFKFLHNKMKRLLTFFIKASFLKVFYGYKPPMSTRFFDLNSFVLHLHNLSVFLLLCRVFTLMVKILTSALICFLYLFLNLSIFQWTFTLNLIFLAYLSRHRSFYILYHLSFIIFNSF